MFTGKQREKLSKDGGSYIDVILKDHIEKVILLLYGLPRKAELLDIVSNDNKDYLKLKEEVEDRVYSMILSQSLSNLQDREEEDEIVGFMFQEVNGTNIADSIVKHIATLSDEIRAYIELSIYFNITVSKGLMILLNNLKNAYSTDLIRKGYDEIKNPATKIIKARGMTVRDGEYKTSIANLKRLATYSILGAITFRQISDFIRNGAIGWVSHRGSSYPCSFCDSKVGFHPISDHDFPPYHGNCYCHITPQY